MRPLRKRARAADWYFRRHPTCGPGEFRCALDAIEPPPEHEAGHRFFRACLIELQETAAAINEAVADDDDDHLEREIERSGFRPLAESVFGGTSGPED